MAELQAELSAAQQALADMSADMLSLTARQSPASPEEAEAAGIDASASSASAAHSEPAPPHPHPAAGDISLHARVRSLEAQLRSAERALEAARASADGERSALGSVVEEKTAGELRHAEEARGLLTRCAEAEAEAAAAAMQAAMQQAELAAAQRAAEDALADVADVRHGCLQSSPPALPHYPLAHAAGSKKVGAMF